MDILRRSRIAKITEKIMTRKLIHKSYLYPLLRLAIPLALTGMVQSSIYFFQTLFLAHVSPDVLAAGALVSWLFATLAVILFGTLSSMNILIAHKYGAKDHKSISYIVRDGILLSIFISIPAFCLIWNMSSIFLIFGQSPSIALLAKSYLHALAWGLLPNFLMIAFLEFIIGLGHARIIMIFTIITVVLNILFSFLLIFGKLGMPVLGIAGAGWGMTISNWVTLVVLATYVLTSKDYKGYFKNIFNLKKTSYLPELLKVGIPMGLMYCFEVTFFLAVALIMGSFGSYILAANQIVMQYSGLLIGGVFAIAQAITVRMGHLLGAKDIPSAEITYYMGFIIVSIFIGISAIFYWFFPSMLISIDLDIHDSNNLEIVRCSEHFFAIAAPFMILESIRVSLFGALRGLKDTKFPLLISFISFWCIALPIGYFLATYFQFGGDGIWWGMVIGAGFSATLLFWRFKSKIHLAELDF